ncbi:MAG: hypothetical protein LKG15_00820 [Corynebacterium provencense]|uniref:sirohydrochlorin chelatase n=1 Tax=Corynebacterium provencense TaxID=1737425 RepID=UPI002989CB8F|nr:hypothetical protein [Corynebacterium provencense]
MPATLAKDGTDATPVICLAHGSRHPEADAAVARIADAVGESTGVPARAAYLDFSPLTFGAVARDLAEAGYRQVTVVPMLFTRAYHLNNDVPEVLWEAARETGLEFRLADGPGTGDDVAALLASRIPRGTRRYILYSVGSSVAGANETVAGLAVRAGNLAGLEDGDVVALTATGPGNTGPAALLAAVEQAAGSSAAPVHVAPLFTSPGTLWDAAVDVLHGLPRDIPVTTGVPLDTAVVPVVLDRVRAAWAGRPRE